MVSRFKVGEVIRCMNADNIDGITLNKDYLVLRVQDTCHFSYIWIVDDIGKEWEYLSWRFHKTIDRRHLVIEKILE